MKATIVSVYPFPVVEKAPGLIPGEYLIPSAPIGGIGILVVDDAFSDIYTGGTPPQIRVRKPAEEVASAIVNSCIQNAFLYTPDAHMGIMVIEGGDASKRDIEKEHEKEIRNLRKIQHAWFIKLVKQADDDWNQYHKHGMISDLQRYAAKTLDLKKEWSTITKEEDFPSCPACKEPVHPEAIVCKSCKAILDKEKYKNFQLPSAV